MEAIGGETKPTAMWSSRWFR